MAEGPQTTKQRVPLACRIFGHRWVEKSRITWKNDDLTEGSVRESCERCEARRRRFLEVPDGY